MEPELIDLDRLRQRAIFYADCAGAPSDIKGSFFCRIITFGPTRCSCTVGRTSIAETWLRRRSEKAVTIQEAQTQAQMCAGRRCAVGAAGQRAGAAAAAAVGRGARRIPHHGHLQATHA